MRSARDFSDFGSNPFTSFAQIRRAARILAISMKKLVEIAQKNDRRGANWSMVSPAARPALMYSTPSASV